MKEETEVESIKLDLLAELDMDKGSWISGFLDRLEQSVREEIILTGEEYMLLEHMERAWLSQMTKDIHPGWLDLRDTVMSKLKKLTSQKEEDTDEYLEKEVIEELMKPKEENKCICELSSPGIECKCPNTCTYCN